MTCSSGGNLSQDDNLFLLACNKFDHTSSNAAVPNLFGLIPQPEKHVINTGSENLHYHLNIQNMLLFWESEMPVNDSK